MNKIMKKKEKKELFMKTIQELKKSLQEKRGELSLLGQEQVQGKLKNTRAIFNKRKEISRILTIIQGKELLENVKNI